MPPKARNEAQEVAIWRARLERAIERRKANRERWKENLKFYTDGTGNEVLVGDLDQEIIINKVFASLRAQLPGLMFNNPHFFVRPKRPLIRNGVDVSVEQAKKQEFALNYYWQQLDGKFHTRLAILSSFIAIGAIKVGYVPHFIENPSAGKFLVDDDGNLQIDGRSGLPKLEHGDYLRTPKGEIIFNEATGLPELEPGELLQDDEFFIEWVNYNDLLFDPEGKNDFKQHSWLAEEWERPTEEVKEDPLFKNTEGLKPSHFVGDAEKGTEHGLGTETESQSIFNEAVKADQGRTRGYTIYDFKYRRIRVVVENPPAQTVDRFLRDDPMPPEMGHGPIEFLRFNEIPGKWEPLPDVEPLKSPANEVNVMRSKVLTHLSRGDRKYGYDPNIFENPEDIEKLKGGGDMVMVPMPGGGEKSIWPVPLATMDPGIYQAIPDLDRSFDELAGQPAEARGVARSQTATQATIIENKGAIRESDRRDNIIADFLVGVARKLLLSLKANMTQELWIRIAGDEREKPFLDTVTPEDLQAETEVEVQIGSLLPKTSAVQRQQLLALMGLFAQAPNFATDPVALTEILEVFEINNTGLAQRLSAMAREAAAAQQNAGGQPSQSGEVAGLPNTLGGSASAFGGLPTPTPAGNGRLS